MSLPEIVTRDKWIHARVAFLEREKALTKARDELAAERRRLPMVEVAEDYRFSAADGSSRTLLDLFEGRHQLIVDHYMFDPDWEDGCMSCACRAPPVREYGPLARTRHDDRGCFPRADRKDRAAEAQDGLDVPVVLELRQSVQLRLRRVVR